MNVRRASTDDRERLYALWDEWIEQESPIPSWVEGAREGTRTGIDNALGSGSAVIAEEGGEVLGFACGLMKGAAHRRDEAVLVYLAQMATTAVERARRS